VGHHVRTADAIHPTADREEWEARRLAIETILAAEAILAAEPIEVPADPRDQIDEARGLSADGRHSTFLSSASDRPATGTWPPAR
jgi:hypothetical protein